ncbi:hypothetical protein Y032_0465g1948 [Ancylostoma ceylanicum]|uniref:CHHC U11-48K-type domain-containing protein n=1 Tax=Ancylostoma ceylanicum TaxID=53326 RepID=A0A016WYF7_9BILA|nr:hypothetical protein Y032_0465g1948 [Ancylostoma ceylanicum]
MTCPRHTRSMGDCAALIVCPYSLAHHVSPAAFPGHLRSCRMEYLKKNSPNIKIVRCSVDRRHIVPDVELSFHERHCGDAYFRKINAELIEPSTSSESYESDSDSGTSSSDDYSSSSPSLSDREERFQMNQNLDV